MDEAERVRLAEAFLQEAVFRSRAAQAAGTFLAQTGADVARQCGLGLEAAVVLDLSPRGRELFAALWPDANPDVERVHALLREWIGRQDALDRERNHYLKAFRQKHGFDRNAYTLEQRAEFEGGLERVNAAVEAERRDTAKRLLG